MGSKTGIPGVGSKKLEYLEWGAKLEYLEWGAKLEYLEWGAIIKHSNLTQVWVPGVGSNEEKPFNNDDLLNQHNNSSSRKAESQ